MCGRSQNDIVEQLSSNKKKKNIKFLFVCVFVLRGFPSGSDCKESAHNAGDLRSILRLGGSPVGGHSNPLQYSCQENSMDRGAWRATVHGVTESQT